MTSRRSPLPPALEQDLQRRIRLARPISAPFFILCLLVLGGGTALHGQWADLADARAAAASQRLGFPIIWRADKLQAPIMPPGLGPLKLEPAPPYGAATAIDIIEQAFAEYPPGYASRFFDKVYIVSGILNGDRRAGGLAHDKSIWVEAFALEYDRNRRYTRFVVFHESATVILNQIILDRPAFEKVWSQINPPGFQYWSQQHPEGDEGDAALGRNMQPTPDLFPSGFINDYGRTSVRADFDTIVDAMFTQAPWMAKWVAENPRLRQKMTLVQNQLMSTDPRFRDVFTKLGLPVAP